MSEKETLRLSDELLDVLEGLAEMRLDKMTWDELERMQVALPALLADARRVETLTNALHRWGRHEDGCTALGQGEDRSCSCGLTEAAYV